MTKAYPNDLTWEQWELIADLFPEAIGWWSSTYYSNVCCRECHFVRIVPRLYVACIAGRFSRLANSVWLRAWRQDGTWLKVRSAGSSVPLRFVK